MTGRRVVVTGIGTINPLGNNIEEFFSNLEKGVSGAAPITHFNAEKFKTQFACEVKITTRLSISTARRFANTTCSPSMP